MSGCHGRLCSLLANSPWQLTSPNSQQPHDEHHGFEKHYIQQKALVYLACSLTVERYATQFVVYVVQRVLQADPKTKFEQHNAWLCRQL
ncbi:hypothetical protein AVEN_81599-1 [Araneus ventricosus]|uniref:Uncharacterized protein n=1 Tax=Araneus ventricosus TaxID=182803 RepID=A0A4Y2FMS8_ARAVE|nr:hypothetical protein AVEN_81599-1 [Araneus ventricosus]